jgi:hypothetical protein
MFRVQISAAHTPFSGYGLVNCLYGSGMDAPGFYRPPMHL